MTNTRKAFYGLGVVGVAALAYWLFKPVKSSSDIYREMDVFQRGADTGVIQLSDMERNNVIDAFNSGVNAFGNPIGLSPEARDAAANRMADSAVGLSGGGITARRPLIMTREANRDTRASATILSTLTDLASPAPTTSERLGGRGIPGATF